MMQCKLVAALRILLLLSVLQRVCRGIDCYQCNSNVDANCDTKSVDPRYLRSCPTTHGYCRKSNSIYYFTDSRDYITIRECAVLRSEEKECYRGRYSRDSYQHVCECKVSGCNRSINLVVGIPAVVVVSQIIVHLFSTSFITRIDNN